MREDRDTRWLEWDTDATLPEAEEWQGIATVSEPRRGGKSYWHQRAAIAEGRLDAMRETVRDVATDAGDDKGTYGQEYYLGMATVAARIRQALAVDAPVSAAMNLTQAQQAVETARAAYAAATSARDKLARAEHERGRTIYSLAQELGVTSNAVRRMLGIRKD